MPDREKRLPIHVAAENGHYQACELMLKKGANPNLPDRSRFTALAHAIRGSKATESLIDLLVEHGASLGDSQALRARAINQAAMSGQVGQLRLYKRLGMTLQVSPWSIICVMEYADLSHRIVTPLAIESCVPLFFKSIDQKS